MAIKGISQEHDPEKYRSIIGVDSSSKGIAWTHLYDGKMVAQGKIVLKQRLLVDKLGHMYVEWKALLDSIKPDHVMVEKSIFVRNPATARTLSYIVGALLSIAKGEGYEVSDVEPSTWKSFFGYKNLSPKFVKEAKEKLGTTEGKKLCDRLRKSQTWRVIRHNYPNEAIGSVAEKDNDISDSWGVALLASHLLSAPIVLENSDSIRLDLDELSKLGLRL